MTAAPPAHAPPAHAPPAHAPPVHAPPADAKEPLHRVVDLRAYLAGAWQIRRVLEDRRLGRRGHFEGRAAFTPLSEDVPAGEDVLAYREEGRLVLAGFETLAHQRYLYAFPAPQAVSQVVSQVAPRAVPGAVPGAAPRAAPGAARQRAEVRFADGRAFHALDLGAGRWTAEHLCGADRYRGGFRALGPDNWRVEWRIVGPRKDQVLVSRFTRGA